MASNVIQIIFLDVIKSLNTDFKVIQLYFKSKEEVGYQQNAYICLLYLFMELTLMMFFILYVDSSYCLVLFHFNLKNILRISCKIVLLSEPVAYPNIS